ncbi:DUF2784 domain-containing protein [Rhodococcus sp. NPDC058505]|uniref:DUF2784 domain-containing protein n=1 Tax=unclassified Rhodococcus (in: high G+C Gram-positive bacteria) TaxID=192944 RepID=UPI00366664FF
MVYRVVEVLAMVGHFAFLGYLVFGGFLAWRWPRTIAVHGAAVLWGAGSVLVGYDCPLTAVQNWARVAEGGSPLPSSGFIAHYITGVLYPVDAENLVRLLVVAVVLLSWIGYPRQARASAHRHPRMVDAST